MGALTFMGQRPLEGRVFHAPSHTKINNDFSEILVVYELQYSEPVW